MTTGLAFVGSGEPSDYGHLFSRLRWRRAIRAEREASLEASAAADRAFAAAEIWAVVLTPGAIPAGRFSFSAVPSCASARPGRLEPDAGRAAVHTVRELETAGGDTGASPGPAPLLAFRRADFPPQPGETVETFVKRVAADPQGAPLAGFASLVFHDPSNRERPELIERMPPGARRLADVGCGAGATSAALKRGDPRLHVTGVELDPAAAERAAARLDRVISGDASLVLSTLARGGERFDAFLLGDVLEHTADPIALLAGARAAAEPGARLVASVPNAGHLSVIRDLVFGRFDPAPAGLLDAGHLRWFTLSFLAEALEEAGWSVGSIEGIQGAPAPDADGFLRSLAGWPGLDPNLLSVYQWIAVATA